MKILTIHNRKGGVGKTALAVQFAYDLASRGYRTVLVEFDGQRNASSALARGKQAAVAPFSSLAVFNGEAGQLPEAPLVCVAAEDGMDRMYDRGSARYNEFLNNLATWFYALRKGNKVDVCLIDNAPGEDIRWGAGMVTADAVILPTTLRQETIEGVSSFINHGAYGFRRVKFGSPKTETTPALAPLNPKLLFLGILPTLVQRAAIESTALQWLVSKYPDNMFRLSDGHYANLKHRIAVADAQKQGVFIGAMKTKESREVWAEWKPVMDEIIRRLELPAPIPMSSSEETAHVS
jgi:chromosome partitioning protein